MKKILKKIKYIFNNTDLDWVIAIVFMALALFLSGWVGARL